MPKILRYFKKKLGLSYRAESLSGKQHEKHKIRQSWKNIILGHRAVLSIHRRHRWMVEGERVVRKHVISRMEDLSSVLQDS